MRGGGGFIKAAVIQKKKIFVEHSTIHKTFKVEICTVITDMLRRKLIFLSISLS